MFSNKFAEKIGINQDCPRKNGFYVHPTHKYTFATIPRKGNLCCKVYYSSKSTMVFIKILQSFTVCSIFSYLLESKCQSNEENSQICKTENSKSDLSNIRTWPLSMLYQSHPKQQSEKQNQWFCLDSINQCHPSKKWTSMETSGEKVNLTCSQLIHCMHHHTEKLKYIWLL